MSEERRKAKLTFLKAVLANPGKEDIRSSVYRDEGVVKEVHTELEAAGIVDLDETTSLYAPSKELVTNMEEALANELENWGLHDTN